MNNFVVLATDSSGAFNDSTLTISDLAPALQTYFLDGSLTDGLASTTATLTGTATYGPGVIGQALTLDGTTNYLTLGTLYGTNHNNFRVARWIHWSGGNAWQRIFDFDRGTDIYLFLTPSNGSDMRFLIRENGVDHYLNTAPLPMNRWVHISPWLSTATPRRST